MKKEDGASKLDKVLSYWEDVCFIRGIQNQISGISLDGPLAYAPNFRKYILGYKGQEFDFMKYVGFSGHEMGAISTIPLSVLAWNHHSRRIFYLPSDIQTIMDATSLGGITWDEVKFPFKSFMVSLEEPLLADNGHEYDCILLSRIDPFISASDEPIIEMRMFPKNLDGYVKISKTERKKVDSFIHNGQIVDVLDFLRKRPSAKDLPLLTIHLFSDMLKDEKVKKSIPHVGELTGQPDMKRDQAIDSALHIIINLCLYLENFHSTTMRSGDKEKKTKKLKRKEFDPSAITDTADIFTVTCHFKMSRAKIDEIVKEMKSEKLGHEKGAFWRKAHWRRKPYCGKIPWNRAPKDWIYAKIISPYMLPPDSLPKGSKAVLT